MSAEIISKVDCFEGENEPKINEWCCGVCGVKGEFEKFFAHEQMFGFGGEFEYRLCAACGCLQIASVPTDLTRYYGDAYYSMAAPSRHNWLASTAIRARNRYLSGQFNIPGAFIARWRPYVSLAALRPLRLGRDARILDVGCGTGDLLIALKSAGFSRLLGVDPFVDADMVLEGGLQIKRISLPEFVADPERRFSFDLVMFHHSLEHILNPKAALLAARGVLVPGGRCLVRIPTVSSYAWRHYGTHWCALDAPRHLMLHSRDSIALLAKNCGFRVEKIVDDSLAFQFWGSEQYRRGLKLMRPGCHEMRLIPGQFSRGELDKFERRAAELNRQSDGDTIVVYLKVDA